MARAWAPAHITAFFMIFENGSTGAGINLADGVETEVCLGKGNRILINGKRKTARTSEKVIAKYREIKEEKFEACVEHRCGLPIGCGFGLSGAGAFSLSLALNEELGTGLSYGECAEVARLSEIEEGTGLGDVIAQKYGGLLIGEQPYPSKEAGRIDINEKYVVGATFGKIDTGEIIGDEGWKEKINSIGLGCMKRFRAERTKENFVALAREFSVESGLADGEIRKVLDEVKGASMAMLGRSVFVLSSSPEREKKLLESHFESVYISEIADGGAKLL